MKKLIQLTIGLLLLQAILMVCRVAFFPRYAPSWFWTILSVLLAFTGILVLYCTVQRVAQFKRIQSSAKRVTIAGSVVFHVGIALVILAGFYYTVFQYKALLYITEGQTIIDSPQHYQVLSEGPVQSTDFEDVALTLLTAGVDFYDPSLVEHLSAQMQVTDMRTGETREVEAAMNRPFRYQSRKAAIYKFGFAPLLNIRSPEGELLWQGFVSLDLVGGKPDLFIWPLSDDQVRVEASIDEQLKLTFFFSAAGEDVVLSPGNPAASFLGTSFEVSDYRYWLGFVVTSIRGTYLVLTGLFLVMIGIVVRYLYVFKDSDYRVIG